MTKSALWLLKTDLCVRDTIQSHWAPHTDTIMMVAVGLCDLPELQHLREYNLSTDSVIYSLWKWLIYDHVWDYMERGHLEFASPYWYTYTNTLKIYMSPFALPCKAASWPFDLMIINGTPWIRGLIGAFEYEMAPIGHGKRRAGLTPSREAHSLAAPGPGNSLHSD